MRELSGRLFSVQYQSEYSQTSPRKTNEIGIRCCRKRYTPDIFTRPDIFDPNMQVFIVRKHKNHAYTYLYILTAELKARDY